MYAPVQIRPAMVYAWKLTRDPEIGWFLQKYMEVEATGNPTPLRVTKAALLGLGHYQPLLNFWLYRPVDKPNQPRQKQNILPFFFFASRPSHLRGEKVLRVRTGFSWTLCCCT